MKPSVLIFVLVFTFKLTFSQKTYATQPNDSLQKYKTLAVEANDFEKASEIKKEIDLRAAKDKKIIDLQTELEEKVKAEDYTRASALKKEIKSLKESVARKEELRKLIINAVSSDDFANAAKYKAEILQLSGNSPVETTTSPATVAQTDHSIVTSTKPLQGKIEFKSNTSFEINGTVTQLQYTHTDYYKPDLFKTVQASDVGTSLMTITNICNPYNHEFLFTQLITPPKGTETKVAFLMTITKKKRCQKDHLPIRKNLEQYSNTPVKELSIATLLKA